MPNRSSKPPRPRDPNQRAKLIVEIATGQVEEKDPDEDKNPAAVELGRLGGKKGGQARAEKLSPERRAEISKKAAAVRWSKSATKEQRGSHESSAQQPQRRVVRTPEGK
jgi:hypothetical protein